MVTWVRVLPSISRAAGGVAPPWSKGTPWATRVELYTFSMLWFVAEVAARARPFVVMSTFRSTRVPHWSAAAPLLMPPRPEPLPERLISASASTKSEPMPVA